MASALSRALKLPGKKGSELGEYDPLTQADSDDESEEDDLVLNYPRNGLGATKLRGGRSGKEDQGQDEEDEEDEDEWTEHFSDRDGVKGGQFWSQRGAEERGGAGPSGGAGALGGEAEEKRIRERNAVRSAFFLVPVVCVAVLMLLCAFLLPCRKAELERKLQWRRQLGDAGGLVPPALALWDVDGDSVEDVLLGVTEWSNSSHATKKKVYSAVALSAAGGGVLWRKAMRESVMYIQCGLQYSAQQSSVCVLVGKSVLMAINGTTGKSLWSASIKNIESQAVLLPDIQGDSASDLLVATLPADETLDLSLTLVSGMTGEVLGNPVSFNLTGQGKLIGPLLHETQHGAYYIMFGLGNVQAVALQDLYLSALGNMPITRPIRRKDSGWEGLKKINSSFIRIYNGLEPVEFLLPLVADLGSSLDAGSNVNSSRSDWLLVYGSSTLSVLRQQDLHKQWTLSCGSIHSQPALGHFNTDGVLDIFAQHSANGTMTAQIVDGADGRLLWSAEFVCPRLVLGASAVSTSTGQSAFLFWAGDPLRAPRNASKKAVVGGAQPLIRRLFLLHPACPAALLELSSTTDTAVTCAASYLEELRDATYISVSSLPSLDSEPGARLVTSSSLRASVRRGRLVQLGQTPGPAELGAFLRRLAFKRK